MTAAEVEKRGGKLYPIFPSLLQRPLFLGVPRTTFVVLFLVVIYCGVFLSVLPIAWRLGLVGVVLGIHQVLRKAYREDPLFVTLLAVDADHPDFYAAQVAFSESCRRRRHLRSVSRRRP